MSIENGLVNTAVPHPTPKSSHGQRQRGPENMCNGLRISKKYDQPNRGSHGAMRRDESQVHLGGDPCTKRGAPHSAAYPELTEAPN